MPLHDFNRAMSFLYDPQQSRRLLSSPVEFMMWSTRCVSPGGAWWGSRYVKKYLGPGKDNSVRPRLTAGAEHDASHSSAKANTACKAVRGGSLSERRRLPFSQLKLPFHLLHQASVIQLCVFTLSLSSR